MANVKSLTSSPLVRRVLKGMGAWGSAQVATIVIQLASLPIFLSFWSIETYGTWLTLTTIPSYLALADFGFLTATSNKMIALESVGKHKEANVSFQSAIMFILGVSAVMLLLALAGMETVSWAFPKLEQYSGVVLVLTVAVVVSLFGSLAQTVFVATQGFAAGTYLYTVARMLDWIGSIVGLVVGGTFMSVALYGTVCRFAFTLYFIYLSHRRRPEIKWGLRDASKQELRDSLKPATLFMVFPLASALSLQGFIVLVTATLGPAATAVFSSYRTIARIVVQCAAALSQSMWPEFSRMHSTQEVDRLRRTYTHAARLSSGIGLAASLTVLAISPLLIAYWSKGHIAFSWSLMGAFMVYSLIASMWHVPRVMLMSVNQHALLARQYFTFSMLSLVLGVVLAREIGIMGPVLAMVAGEVAMWLASRRSVSNMWQAAPA